MVLAEAMSSPEKVSNDKPTRFDGLLLELGREHAQEVARLQSIIANLQHNDNKSDMPNGESKVQELASAPSDELCKADAGNSDSLALPAIDEATKEDGATTKESHIEGMSMSQFPLNESWMKPPSKGLWGHELDWQMVKRIAAEKQDSDEGGEVIQKSCGMASPAERWRLSWDCLGAFFVCYDMISIPFHLSFNPESNTFTVVSSWTVSLFWAMDMVLSAFFTGFYLKGRLVMKRKDVLVHYLRGWFWIDIVVVAPDLTMKFMGSTSNIAGLGRALRAARLVRLLRMLRAAKMQKFLLHLYDAIDSEYSFAVLGLFKSVLIILAMNHIVACIWFAIGRLGNSVDFRANWVENSGRTPVIDEDLTWKYTTSLHWAITQFTPASMDVSATNSLERVFSIMVLFIAMVSISSLIGSVSAAMNAMRSAASDDTKQTWMLRRYLRRKEISWPLQDRVFKYLDYQHELKQHSKTIPAQDVKLLMQIPPELQKHLSNEMNAPYLCQHPVFGYMDSEISQIMFRICHSAVDTFRFALNDVAFYCDEDAQHMFFVRSGRFEYQLIDGHVHAGRLGPKTWAAEAVLWTTWRHRGSMIAVEHSDVLAVCPKDFQAVCQIHPRPWYFAQQYARQFVSCLNSVSRGHVALLDVLCRFDELSPVAKFDTLGQQLFEASGQDVHKSKLWARTSSNKDAIDEAPIMSQAKDQQNQEDREDAEPEEGKEFTSSI